MDSMGASMRGVVKLCEEYKRERSIESSTCIRLGSSLPKEGSVLSGFSTKLFG